MPVPIVYRTTGELLVSYSFTDLMARTGYIRYYAGKSDMSGADVQYLSPLTLDSNPIYQEIAYGGTSFGAGVNLDFDITFNQGATLRGDALLNITQEQVGGNNLTIFVRCTISHVRGATVTVIGGPRESQARTGVANLVYRENLVIALTETTFAKGDILRLNVTQYGKRTGANETGRVYFDPGLKLPALTDVDGRSIGTDLIFDVPFKIAI